MWDPVSIFIIMWALNTGVPEARLNVDNTLELREQELINRIITGPVKSGVNYDYKTIEMYGNKSAEYYLLR